MGGAAALPVLGLLIGALRPVGRLLPAKLLDRAHGLHDRVSNAVAFSAESTRTPFMDAAIEDAKAHAKGLSARRAMPLRLPRDLLATLGLGAGVALLALVEVPRVVADIIAQFDVDLLILAGRTSKLEPVRGLFVSEMPVSPPRIKTMADYRVGDWYPSKWRSAGRIKDPKSTVAAGAAILHLASRNQLPGLLLEGLEELQQRPIYGLYQTHEPHIARVNELFREGDTSPAFLYTRGMMIGFRNVDAQEMDGSPLFEVLPASPQVEQALLEDRVKLKFGLKDGGQIEIASVESQRQAYSFTPEDFWLRLKTVTVDRYWLDTGVLTAPYHARSEEEDA